MVDIVNIVNISKTDNVGSWPKYVSTKIKMLAWPHEYPQYDRNVACINFLRDEPLVSIWTCCQDSITSMLSGACCGNCELCDITAENIYNEQTNRQKNIGSKMCNLLLGWTKCNFSSHVNLIFCAGHQKLKASALYCSVMEKFEIFRKSIQNITGERYLQILPFLTNDYLSSQR